MKKVLCFVIALVLSLSLFGGAFAADGSVSGKVAIYSSMYPFVLEMLDKALQEQFPNLEPAGDEGSFFIYGGTSAIVNRIYRSMREGQLEVDMMLVAEPSLSLEMKAAGYLHPVEIPEAGTLLRFPYDEDGCWYPVRVCNMVLAYNPEMEAEWNAKGVTIPRTFEAFASDRSLKGLISMGDPTTSGTTFATVAALTAASRYGRQFLRGLAKNDVKVESGSASIRRLQNGECAAAMILEESVLKALKDAENAGTPLTNLACIYPEDGAVLIPSTVMIVNGEYSRNKNVAACDAIEKWFLTEEAQHLIMQGFMHSVLTDSKEAVWHSVELSELMERALDVNWASVYQNREFLLLTWEDVVLNRGRTNGR